MDKQAYCSQYTVLRSWLEADRDNLQRARSALTDIPSPDVREDPVQVSHRNEASYVRLLEEVDRLTAKVRLEEDLLWRLKAEMLPLFSTLPPERASLMGARYISGYPWEIIMEEKNLSKSTALRWHRESLKQLVLPENAVNVAEELERLKAGQDRDVVSV